MDRSAAAILREHIESASDAIEAIELDLADLTSEPAIAALRAAQDAYRRITEDLQHALAPLG